MFTAKARILVYGIPFFYPSHLDKMNKSHYRKGTVIPTNSVWPISAEGPTQTETTMNLYQVLLRVSFSRIVYFSEGTLLTYVDV